MLFNLNEMIPILTTGQVKDGVDAGDFMIDLSEYVKKKDAATKTELQELVQVVAGKLDATPQHKHDISNVKDLREELDSKYDTSQKYSHNVILSDTEKIAYIEAPKVQRLELATNEITDGYSFYVDDSNGDLMIVSPASVLIASYSVASNSWNFGGVNLNDVTNIGGITSEISAIKTANVNTNNVLENHNERITANDIAVVAAEAKITQMQVAFNEYVTKTDAVMKNHYDALLMLCEKHGMVDSNTGDGDKVSPE